MTDDLPMSPGEQIQCSRAGCRNDAGWNVAWRNPRIHGPERVKAWYACDEHREFLHDYLATRGFPVVVVPVGETVDALPEAPRQ